MTFAAASAPTKPLAPLAPALSLASFGGRGAKPRSVLDAGPSVMTTSGRVAIALALRAIGAGPGDTVLLPAYHSASMVPPVRDCGATPVFYPVGRDGSIDVAAIAPGAKALLVTHYFGFLQQMQAIRARCDAAGIALIEDCAHAFFGEEVGVHGHYAIASSMKFYPAYDGGCLVGPNPPMLRSAGMGFELKAILATLEHSFAYGRLRALDLLMRLPMLAKDAIWPLLRKAPLAPASSDSEPGFDRRWLDKRASLMARFQLRAVSAPRIVARRRANYLRLLAAVADLPGCRPLHAVLPDGVCPWLFPLFVDDADAVFARLHGEGVPLVRFGEGVATCANSLTLARQLLSLPCHQELREDELAWIVERLRAALRA